MKDYDISQPLIVIHIPKAAGTSTQEIFKSWFGRKFYRHYINERNSKLPKKRNLNKLHSSQHPICVHGHFNKLRGFGVEDYYPNAQQFITILRDPYELLTSHYFFANKVKNTWKDKSQVPKDDLQTYLKNTKPNMLNHFPREVNSDNYKDIIEEYFIEIGIVEHLNESISRIANKLGKPFDNNIPSLNKTIRDEQVPISFKDDFMELNKLEYDVYNYCLNKYL